MEHRSVTHRIANARSTIERLSPDQLVCEVTTSTIVDVREAYEVERTGGIINSLMIPRGVLEFEADQTSPRHHPNLLLPHRVVVVCSDGLRSSLAALSLVDLGYADVAYLDGGINAWIAQGLPLQPVCPEHFMHQKECRS